nr:MAG TPA: hypothetical protein [Bacteriophage sp.]
MYIVIFESICFKSSYLLTTLLLYPLFYSSRSIEV